MADGWVLVGWDQPNMADVLVSVLGSAKLG